MGNEENTAQAELEKLLKRCSDTEGKLEGGYLHTPDGKRILELVRTELRMTWPKMMELLQRSKATIEKSFSEHGVFKTKDKHTSWKPEHIALIKEFYEKSKKVSSQKESGVLRNEMVREVNNMSGKSVSVNAVRCVARDYEWGSWGWSANDNNPLKIKTAKEVVRGKLMEERMRELILSENILIENDGANLLHKRMSEEFPDIKITKSSWKTRLKKIIWTKDTNKALQEVVRARMDPKEEFCHLFPHIPLAMVETHVRWHRGVVTTKKRSGKALPGIGRARISSEFGDLRKFKMPSTSFDKPHELIFSDKERWSIMFLNGTNVGTKHPADIAGNIVRRALSDADHSGDSAVILTNIIALELKKAGGSRKVGRALVMGDNVNPEIFADDKYREEVRNILRDEPDDKVVYQTAEELLNNILGGWRKISTKPNKKPEYSRSIYVILGINEEELIKTIAYWEVHYWTKLKQFEIDVQIKTAKSALAQAKKDGDLNHASVIEQEIERLEDGKARTRITNVATQEWQRFYNLARAFVVKKIEQTIPNSKVIGQGTSYIKIGKEKIEISIPGHERVTDSLLKDFTGSYGPKALREQLAHTVVICGPWSPQFRMTVREADYDGKRGSVKVFVAPIAVDASYIRNTLSDTVKKEHPLAKAVSSERFQPGVLRLRRSNEVIDADIVSEDALEAHERKVKQGSSRKTNCGTKYIWVHTATDQHWGGRAKEFVTEKESGRRLGMAEAVFHMMRKEGLCDNGLMPVHLFSSNDDPTQGQNFKARTQPDPHELPPQEIERLMCDLLAQGEKTDNPEELRKLNSEMLRLSSYQFEKRGADFLLHQMNQMMERHIEQNVDIFSAILRRAKKAGLILRGVGEFGNATFGGYDTRNVGILNFGGGNHFEHTVDGELIEGPFYAERLRLLLRARPEWKNNDEFLKHAVVAPHYSGQSMAWGRMRIGDGYEYGLDLRDTPPRMSGWGDPLYGAVSNDTQRGNYTRIFNGRMTLKTYGDKHFFAAVSTPYAFYHMCASGTHTDRYGERGFPPNNTGVSFVGLPVDGPDSGPIKLRILPYDVIRDFVEDNPRQFDWELFLPNPA